MSKTKRPTNKLERLVSEKQKTASVTKTREVWRRLRKEAIKEQETSDELKAYSGNTSLPEQH